VPELPLTDTELVEVVPGLFVQPLVLGNLLLYEKVVVPPLPIVTVVVVARTCPEVIVM
jgi:hypothetical protein